MPNGGNPSWIYTICRSLISLLGKISTCFRFFLSGRRGAGGAGGVGAGAGCTHTSRASYGIGAQIGSDVTRALSSLL